MSAEHWKSIPGYGLYQISDMGRVLSFHWDKERLMKPRAFEGGLAVTLIRPGERGKGFLVHRLVLTAFQPLPAGLDARQFRVKFEDGNAHNCRLDNLSWIALSGEGSNRHTLTQAQVDEIRGLWLTDKYITQHELACRFEVSDSTVAALLSGRTWPAAPINMLTKGGY